MIKIEHSPRWQMAIVRHAPVAIWLNRSYYCWCSARILLVSARPWSVLSAGAGLRVNGWSGDGRTRTGRTVWDSPMLPTPTILSWSGYSSAESVISVGHISTMREIGPLIHRCTHSPKILSRLPSSKRSRTPHPHREAVRGIALTVQGNE